MKLRPYRESILPEVVSLANEAEASAYEFVPFGEDGFREELKGASLALVATDDLDQIAGLAYLSKQWYGETFALYLRPGSRQWEVGELLLSALEPRAQTDQLGTEVEPSDHERIAFFSERGYRSESSLYQMSADLDRRRSLHGLPAGCTIGSLKAGEEEALIQLANTAYAGERLRPGILARWQERDPSFSASWVQVVRCNGQLVGAVVARSDYEYNEYYHASRGYLGPAATLPDYRGRGLSQALTARAMNFLRERGMRSVCLYTWGGNQPALKLTTNVGFRQTHEWKIFGKRVRG